MHSEGSSNNEFVELFQQIILELLFDFTFDSYKLYYHNSISLLSESLEIATLVNDGVINKTNLTPIIEELTTTIETDEILQSEIGFLYDKMQNTLNVTSDTKDIVATLNLINQKLNLLNYKERYELKILDMVENDIDYPCLFKTLNNYIRLLIFMGYNRRYVYHVTKYYFNKLTNLNSKDRIKEYFKIFSFEVKKYTVICPVAKELYNTTFWGKDRKVVRNLDDVNVKNMHKLHRFRQINRNYYFIVYKEVEAFDYYSACIACEDAAKHNLKLYNFFCHDNFDYTGNTYLTDDSEHTFIIKEINKPISKRLKSKKNEANTITKNVMNKIAFVETKEKIIKLLEMHNNIQRSNVYDMQFIHLWAGLETLFIESKAYDELNSEKSTDKEHSKKKNIRKSNIDNVIYKILPFLKCVYIHSHMENLLNDIELYDRDYNKNISELFDKINTDTDDDVLKLTMMVMLDQYEETRNELISKTSEFALLNYRIKYYVNEFSDFNSLIAFLSRHTLRLKWHIRRLYLVRNRIVHYGEYEIENITLLINNLHSYFDTVVEQLFYFGFHHNNQLLLDEVILYFNLSEKFLDSFLKKCVEDDKHLNDETIKYLFPNFKYSLPDSISELVTE